ncbi:MAG: dicarboxylate/amino acid:cation symporter [Candidatus Syntrophonatronum acetioxidans]|uniref:Dicarboxylate/amino acid:cation symporter n=1 Tax=Candidatus Syntrophonatronum acetioxidans TaxID=1795816 RepID=A0A424YES9_9FIRM|nr:MAG: dicarboxylate/amino acid:cation symporter [Candidatus Syntrophonatronum acetioxidans]
MKIHPLELLYPKPVKYLTGHLQGLIKGRLWLRILLAMFLGIMVGMVLGPDVGLVDKNASLVIGSWLALPGQIFLGLIQMIVVPLVFASVIMGLAASEDMDQLSRMGSRLAIYFIVTTVLAIVIGLGVALLVQPGIFIEGDALVPVAEDVVPLPEEEPVETPEAIEVPEIIASLLPENPLGAMVEKEMFQIVLLSIIFGLALISMPPKQSNPLLELLSSMQEVCMTVVRWAMILAPLAVFGLLAQTTITTGLDALLGMAVYVATVLGGLLLLLLVYLIIVLLIARKSPRWFLQEVREVQLLAFSTSSSAAVMPLSIEVAEEKLGVKPSTSQFLIPLGATINMNGTALYQGAATVFLAQVFGVELTLPSLLLIVVMTVGASIGSSATPGVGIVILAMVLTSVGIPASGIALILGVDRILDMSRTAINVTGDLAACLVMDRWVPGSKSTEG